MVPLFYREEMHYSLATHWNNNIVVIGVFELSGSCTICIVDLWRLDHIPHLSPWLINILLQKVIRKKSLFQSIPSTA